MGFSLLKLREVHHRRPSLKTLNIRRCHMFWGIGIALNVALGAVTEPSLQLIGISAGDFGQLEGKGMAQVMRAERCNMSYGLALFCIMPSPDVREDEIECAQRQSSIRSTNGNTGRRQKERRL